MGLDPADIAARLSKTKDSCRKCGTVFSWEDGFLCANKLEIKDTVVACPKCHSVYIPNIVSGGMSLGNDVTGQYPQAKQNNSNESNAGCSWYMKLIASLIIGVAISQIPLQILLSAGATENIVLLVGFGSLIVSGVLTWFVLGKIKIKPAQAAQPKSRANDESHRSFQVSYDEVAVAKAKEIVGKQIENMDVSKFIGSKGFNSKQEVEAAFLIATLLKTTGNSLDSDTLIEIMKDHYGSSDERAQEIVRLAKKVFGN